MTKQLSYMLICAVLLIAGVSKAANQDKWLIKSVKVNYTVDANFNQPAETEVTYANGHQAKIKVIDFKLIDKFVSRQGIGFVLFAGYECAECDAEKSLYVHAIQDAVYSAVAYPYPGKHFSRENKQLVSETRVFYGECLTQKPDNVVLFYTRYLDEQQQWQKVLESLQFKGTKVIHAEQTFKQNTLVDIEALLNSAQCFEIYA